MNAKNEAGYTLVLVLLTITLIFIFSLTLISNVLNSANQNKKTEEKIQLNRLLEMGITYVEESVDKASSDAATSLYSSSLPESECNFTNLTDQYVCYFKHELKNYKLVPNQELNRTLEEEAEQFKMVIESIKQAENDNSTIEVTYTVTASLNEYIKESTPPNIIRIKINEHGEIENPDDSSETENPDTESEFSKFVKANNIFLYTNNLDLNGQPTIIGPGATAVIRQVIDDKHNSLQQVTNVYQPTNATTFADIPNLKQKSWYDERGYTSSTTLTNNMKYFGPTIGLNNNGNSPFINVTIASKGDITLNGDFTGVLFAPNGTVTIAGNKTFKGIIVANKITFSGTSAEVYFEASSELPF